MGRFAKQIAILTEQHATEGRGPIEQQGVGKPIASILIRGENINPAKAQARGDRTANVMVHVERQTQGRSPDARNFARPGVSPACARSDATSRQSCSMRASICCL